MAITKLLDISTGHVTQFDMELLAEPSDKISAFSYAEGCIIITPQYPFQYKHLSKSFYKVVQYALENDCDHIRLDADGHSTPEEVEALDNHDW